MPSGTANRRRPPRLAALAAVAVAALAAAGCDAREDADFDNGRTLFIAQCGSCHILAEAGTSAPTGPDLDAAFADARAHGMDSDTIEGVVEAQIGNPRETDPDDPTFMPADLVTGSDAEDVAYYVGQVAGVPEIEPPEMGPEETFTSKCGSCHILEAAGTSGTIGPSLDEVLPGQSADQVLESIVDPNAEITQGFSEGVMPADFGETISEEDLDALVQYMLDSIGGGS